MQQPRVNEKQVGEAFWGKRLTHLKKQTETFRNILEKHEFHEVQLPTCLPSSHFKSRVTGENILPKGPTFVDETGAQWALCSDQTTFAAHFVLESRYQFNKPVRLGYVGKVFSWRTN